jgi:hypothetical protein
MKAGQITLSPEPSNRLTCDNGRSHFPKVSSKDTQNTRTHQRSQLKGCLCPVMDQRVAPCYTVVAFHLFKKGTCFTFMNKEVGWKGSSKQHILEVMFWKVREDVDKMNYIKRIA